MEEFLKNFDLIPRDAVAIPVMALFFAVFWKVFGQTVIARHVALFEAREKNSVGAVHGAENNQAQAAVLRDQFAAELAAARAALSKKLEPKLAAARAEATRIVESGEAEAAALIEAVREEIATEEKKLQINIERDADALAGTISERVLA